MAVRIVRLGTARAPHEGLRIGTVRRYCAEMAQPDHSRVLDLLAALSHQVKFSVGCDCEDESRCHRSVLRALLQDRGATIA